jgi:hypothetical protein
MIEISIRHPGLYCGSANYIRQRAIENFDMIARAQVFPDPVRKIAGHAAEKSPPTL